jgi:tripartite-type tricarboxylate transporter receptor subunit TctC
MTFPLASRCAALSLAIAFFTAAAIAQPFPSKTMHVVVPLPPGAVELMARYMCEKFLQSLGQPCVVDNKAGGGGIIGSDYVAKARPDGHTLLLAGSSLANLPSLYAQMPFDVVRDLAPIALVSSTPVMIGASASFAPKSFREFIDYVRDNPGKVNYTSCGITSTQYLAGEALKSLAGLQMTHIPYKGCGPAEIDVLGGQVPVIISNAARFIPHIRAGRLRGYALIGATRTELAPGYATVAELGFPGYGFDIWFGLLAPARTPKEIIARLNAETNRVIALPDVKERFLSQFYEPLGGTPERFAEVIRTDIERYGKLIREAGIKAE